MPQIKLRLTWGWLYTCQAQKAWSNNWGMFLSKAAKKATPVSLETMKGRGRAAKWKLAALVDRVFDVSSHLFSSCNRLISVRNATDSSVTVLPLVVCATLAHIKAKSGIVYTARPEGTAVPCF